jgi:integrase
MPTIAEYGAKYCERDDLAPTTRDRYRALLRLYINGEPASITRRGSIKGKPIVKAGIGDVRVTELARGHVRQWWQGLPVKEHEASCRQAYDFLRAIMNTALDDELVEVNPVRIKDAARAQGGRERDLDPLPVDVLFAVADAMQERYRLGALLGGVLAMRSGEVRGLQRRDFNLTGEVPTVKVERAVRRPRELLTGQGGYIFHGTRGTGLTWAYRLSGGNLRAVQAIAGHTSPKMALHYQRAEIDYLAAQLPHRAPGKRSHPATWLVPDIPNPRHRCDRPTAAQASAADLRPPTPRGTRHGRLRHPPSLGPTRP